MARIVVFDSGLGSLSIIKSIQKFTKSEIIYFADQKNFPYGTKTKTELKKIIDNTINKLEKKFHPNVIIMASNTPSVLFPEYLDSEIIGVLPPIKKSVSLTKTGTIGILTTKIATKSKELSEYVRKSSHNTYVKKIDATKLIKLVETGKFLTNPDYCEKVILDVLEDKIKRNKIDVITLSSTHLPFLLPMLERRFPSVKFVDPADDIAKTIARRIKKSPRNKLRIYTSADARLFQKHLQKIGIKNTVNFLP
ncbi:MAG: glutamate racemase [Thaumarchaeota archaeon]|nr:glutamate racemase [Nitrososphaerota archaeon]